ncbi:hypothetical protein LTR53_011242 [Teratosphaeriaceae sp. CCFEE 6253]|nr:hypothetical protein LTR53_011242 [Teratosphaeriaceae sp. CCFEE 6253]
MAISAPPSHCSTASLPQQLLSHHLSTAIETGLHSQAIALLSASLTSGTSTRRPALLPPPPYLAFLATIAVHPALTTRTTEIAKREAADEAARYLRHAVKLIGPRGAGLDEAFRFVEGKRLANKRVKSAVSTASPVEFASIKSPYADTESLWTNAENFWHVVGWAFNCSVIHPRRWRRWQVWLALMLDVLEADLASHTNTGTVGDSMFAQYLLSMQGGRQNKRVLMRAILADGGERSLVQFPEIWKGETRPPKREKHEEAEQQSKRRKLDLDNDDYGDYFSADSDADPPAAASTTTRRSRSTSKRPQHSASPSPSTSVHRAGSLGGARSLGLRHRLLTLLLHLSTLAPTVFLSPQDLLDLFTETLPHLPLTIFMAYILPATNTNLFLTPDAQASLAQALIRPFLAGRMSDADILPLTRERFERVYAPLTASGANAVENARVQIGVEALIRLLWRDHREHYRGRGEGGGEGGVGEWRCTESLRQAVEAGIKARGEKVGTDGRRRRGEETEEAVRVLEDSCQRMRAVLDLLPQE